MYSHNQQLHNTPQSHDPDCRNNTHSSQQPPSSRPRQSHSIHTGDVITVDVQDDDRLDTATAIICPPETQPLAETIPVRPVTGPVALQWVTGYSYYYTTPYTTGALSGLLRESRATYIEVGVSTPCAYISACDLTGNSYVPGDLFADLNAGPRLSTAEYTVTVLRATTRMNEFLDHPLVDHKHGGVTTAKIAFAAKRPDGKLAAIAVIDSVNAAERFDRKTVELTRYASHPESQTRGTDNAATWLISKARHWAAHQGFTEFITTAGTDGNTGQIYKALGFDCTGPRESSGDYNRDGRQNFNHESQLLGYKDELSLDAPNATRRLYPRYEQRLATATARTEASIKRTRIADFTGSDSWTKTIPVPQRKPQYFQFTREEKSDAKFIAGGDKANVPAFSRQLHRLVADTDSNSDLSSFTDTRQLGTQTLPSAALGAAVDGLLVGAVLFSGESTTTPAVVDAIFLRETPYPDRTVQWLLTRARDCARLDGYPALELSEHHVLNAPTVSRNVPIGVGFTETGTQFVASFTC